MTNSIEIQVISRILSSEDSIEIDKLCAYDKSYYAVFTEHIQFILDHRAKYKEVPDLFTFQARYPEVVIVKVTEPVEYLETELKRNKQQILLLSTFNTLADLGEGDVEDAWAYLQNQCEMADKLNPSQCTDIVKNAKERSQTLIDYSKQTRIPTGFKELDKIMYGGLSTVEELLVLVARTNTGKSWVCTKMMESANANNFPVLYYSPEMQSEFIGARFDTWRGHFKNSDIFRGQYSEEYLKYLDDLANSGTSAYVVEDKDMPNGVTTVKSLETLVKKLHIKELIIDGLSYISEGNGSDKDYTKYKNICMSLFKLSKTYGCAVVIAMQANRETKDNKDDKGEPFPNIYNVEGSDHPARIATQVIALRQIFEKNILDMRLEKSRSAKNSKTTFSYSWDPNTGNTELIAEGAQDINDAPASFSSSASVPVVSTKIIKSGPSLTELDDDDMDEDVEF